MVDTTYRILPAYGSQEKTEIEDFKEGKWVMMGRRAQRRARSEVFGPLRDPRGGRRTDSRKQPSLAQSTAAASLHKEPVLWEMRK